MKKWTHQRIIYSLFLTILLFVFPASGLAGPRIFYTDITNGPNTGTNDGPGGCYVTIFGKGFGSTKGSSTVTIGSGEVGAYKYWSDNKVSVQLGSSNTSGNIVLSISEGSAIAPDTFTVRPGDIYFVSLNGIDSDGSGAVRNDISKPYRTPNYVNGRSHFGPGDFIVVRGGQYDLEDGSNNLVASCFMRINKSGTEGSPLSLIGYPGEDIILVKSGSSKLAGNSGNVAHWVVANFRVILTTCDTDSGVGVLSIGTPSGTCPQTTGGRFSYGRFVNIDIEGGCGSLTSSQIAIALSDHIKLLGASVHDSGDAGDGSGLDDAGRAHSHPIYLSAEQNNTEIGWCKVYNYARSRALIQVHTDSFGGTCYSYKAITDIFIHDNIIHDVNGQALLADGGTGDIYIYNNLIYSSPAKRINPGYNDVIALRGSGNNAEIRLFNNTVYVNPSVDGQGDLMRFGILGQFPQVTLHNNIFYVAEPQDAYYSVADGDWSNEKVTSFNNIWYGSNRGVPPFEKNPIEGDFHFLNKEANDFRIPLGSPAINAGTTDVSSKVKTDINGKPRGSQPDIGAFEYDDGSSDPPPPTDEVPGAPYLRILQ